jgi:hypothetical protein
MSTLKTNTLSNVAGTASTAIENAINGSAKAWVNFNGTGTVAIRQSYNVSSITDNGTGDYTVNMTNALTDANYSAVVTGAVVNGQGGSWGALASELHNSTPSYIRTSSSYRFLTVSLTIAVVDSFICNVSIFR